jgi:hypothetical protein
VRCRQNYVASVYTPTGWLSVDPPAQSSDEVNDVRAFVSERVWRTPTFTITRGSQNPGVDAAVFRPVPLSGRVFFDQNGNNQDETTPEPGLANFTVNLRRASDDALVTTTTTLADGSYTFSSVAPLTYVVEIVRPDPTNWSFVTPDVPSAGDPLASDVDANGRTGVTSVTSGITVTDVDAGLRGNNTVQGRVFYDRDGSFTQTGNDQDLSGATATLTVTVATINLTTTYTLTATTGAGDPNYSFTGIPGGTSGVTYTLTFDPPDATYTPSLADVGGNDALDSDGPFIQVTGATVGVSNTLDYDQGYWRPVTVRARIFDEITNLPPDNVYSPGDTGITTATVTITTTNGTVDAAQQQWDRLNRRGDIHPAADNHNLLAERTDARRVYSLLLQIPVCLKSIHPARSSPVIQHRRQRPSSSSATSALRPSPAQCASTATPTTSCSPTTSRGCKG